MLFAARSLPLLASAVLVASSALPSHLHHHHAREHHFGQRLTSRNLEPRGGPNDYWNPPSNIYEHFPITGQDIQASSSNAGDLSNAAVNLIRGRLAGNNDDWQVGQQDFWGSSYTAVSDLYTHIYFRQLISGLPAVNSVAHVAIRNSDRKAVSYSGNGFRLTGDSIRVSNPINEDAAFNAAERQFPDLKRVPGTAKPNLAYVTGGDTAAHVWAVQVATPNSFEKWRLVFVHAQAGAVVGSADLVVKATSYTALDITKQNPTEGITRINDPQDNLASPSGWHSGSNTQGNNLITVAAQGLSPLGQSGGGPVFDYGYNAGAGAEDDGNNRAAITNAWYIGNLIHDLSYRYGFTESLFNTQNNDPITVIVHKDAGPGTPSHSIATPPDGVSPRLHLYAIPVNGQPSRPGALNNDIVVHELTHAITSRMTGGGTGLCLLGMEAAAIAEGLSDAMSFWASQSDANLQDFIMGAWTYPPGSNGKAGGSRGGMRDFPYSVNLGSGKMYSSAPHAVDVHGAGEVFAQMLVTVYADFVRQWGFNSNARKQPDAQEGNVVWLRLFMDALTLMPCNPTHQAARDAWIQADVIRYNGVHKCQLWKSFASRGFGSKAFAWKDDGTMPDDACTPLPTPTPKPTPTPTPTPTTIIPDIGGGVQCPFWFPFCADD